MSTSTNPPSPHEDPLAKDKVSLLSEIAQDVANLQSIKSSLAYQYPQEAFYQLGTSFNDLAAKYNRHRRFLGGHRKLLTSSKLFDQTVEQLISTSRDISNLFVRYSRNADAYSWADAAYLIDQVIIELDNLSFLCKR